MVINLHEAEAYTRWRTARDGVDYRLMTELEHTAIRDETERNDPVLCSKSGKLAQEVSRLVNIHAGNYRYLTYIY